MSTSVRPPRRSMIPLSPPMASFCTPWFSEPWRPVPSRWAMHAWPWPATSRRLIPATGSNLPVTPRLCRIPDAQHAGVYRQGEKLFAINRSEAEDSQSVVSQEQVARCFAGLDFDRVDDRVGSGAAMIQEIWRLFLIGTLMALVLEAVLCMPCRPVAATGVAP